MSPSEQEMERLSARLAALKKEVNSVIRDCENDVPINIRWDLRAILEQLQSRFRLDFRAISKTLNNL